VSMGAFQLEFDALDVDRPELGRVALVPWDSETFGIRIADLEIDTSRLCPSTVDLHRALDRWTRSHGVQLVGASVPTSALAHIDVLQAVGFRYLDTTLRVTYPRFQSATLAPSVVEFRAGCVSDVPAVLSIAGSAFRHGRYHADPHVNPQRANQRYRDWVNRVVFSGGPQELYVLAFGDDIRAFSVIEMNETAGHLHLVGVSPEWHGLNATLATLRLFQARGAAVVHSKISAANTAALNSHARLGAEFHFPTALLHRHTDMR
jgi:hypothetical protein